MSGKGTVIEAILAHSRATKVGNFKHVMMSDALKALWPTRPDVKHDMDEGNLVDDGTTVATYRQLWFNDLDHTGNTNMLPDGVTRTLWQVRSALELASDGGYRSVQFVIDAPEEVVKTRREKRLREQHRTDDRPHVFLNRLRVFREHTQPAIELMANIGVPTYTIDGACNPEEVFRQVHNVIRSLDLVTAWTLPQG